ncbi:MAG: uracil-DNA glycosylase [Betaproteobacteria bacterium]|nr:uracil-DNA glycosylase [Betaproteobacteria bacterium]
MPLPEAWSAALDTAALAGLARAEAHVAAREFAGSRAYPPAALRYRALELVAPEDVKVVILGQDPYHAAGQAMGLAFSVPQDVRVPPSLRNIFKELTSDLGVVPPVHGDLTALAEQGVLLLNTSLSVEEGKPASHANIGWEQVTDRLIACASARAGPAVFMLWGRHARTKAPLINATRHLLLQAAHPSPLSARKFLGCRHFSKANAFLAACGAVPIDWSALG